MEAKHFFAVIAIMVCGAAFSQTQVGGTNSPIYFNSDNVGVGTSAPSSNLHISSGTSGDAVLRIEADTDNNNEGDNARIELMQDGGGLGVYLGFDRDWPGAASEPDNYFRIGTRYNGNESYNRLVIHTNSGNVGIGQANPQERMHISDGNLLVDQHDILLRRANNGQNDGMGLRYINGADFGLISDAIIRFIESDANATKMYFDLNQGRMGIGTTSPDAPLTVAGKIHAQEIKVTTSAGADFVFEADYPLRSLEETEQFIKENKHLPDIPSAEEMVEEGITLGEMNVKLLQKIEELTLYVIEQEKKMEKLEKENEDQRKECSWLRNEFEKFKIDMP